MSTIHEIAAAAIESSRREIAEVEANRGNAHPLHVDGHAYYCDEQIRQAQARIAKIEADPEAYVRECEEERARLDATLAAIGL